VLRETKAFESFNHHRASGRKTTKKANRRNEKENQQLQLILHENYKAGKNEKKNLSDDPSGHDVRSEKKGGEANNLKARCLRGIVSVWIVSVWVHVTCARCRLCASMDAYISFMPTRPHSTNASHRHARPTRRSRPVLATYNHDPRGSKHVPAISRCAGVVTVPPPPTTAFASVSRLTMPTVEREPECTGVRRLCRDDGGGDAAREGAREVRQSASTSASASSASSASTSTSISARPSPQFSR
jgi:hypothetical protein